MARSFASSADLVGKWNALLAAALASACGDPVLVVGHDPPPDAGPGVATVIASRQFSLRSIAVDEKRLYWSLDGVGDPQNADETLRERGVIRSCEPNDCAATAITYATEQNGSSIALAGGKIYWSRENNSTTSHTIFACAIEGCSGEPELIVQLSGMVEIAVDGTYLFWVGGGLDMNGMSDLLRCSLSDCPNTTVSVAKVRTASSSSNRFNGGRLALGSTHVYWSQGGPVTTVPGAMMTVPKDGSLPPRALVTGLHAPLGLVLTATDVVWVEYYTLGEVRSCPLLDCSSGPTTIATRQPYANLVAAEGGGVYWFGRRGQMWGDDDEESPADLFECSASGCGGKSPAVMTVESKVPQQTAIDRTHVYWISRGDSLYDRRPGNPFGGPYEGSIKRILRTR